jgi:ribosomal protein L7/L12
MAHRIEWADHPVKKAIEFLDIGIEAGLSNAEAEKFVNAACTGSLYNIDRTSAEDLFGKLQEVLDENEPFDQKANLEPKATVDVILKEAGPNKIAVIKALRAALRWNHPAKGTHASLQHPNAPAGRGKGVWYRR